MENEYVVMLHNLDAGSSELLGTFNEADEYIIENSVKEELCKANKLIKDYKQDQIVSVATVGSYTFDFITYIQLGEQNKKRLSLFLVENCKLGFVAKPLTTFIKSVIIENENVLDTVKKEFNMYIADESTGIDMANESLLAIINRKKQVVEHAKFLVGELRNSNKMYVLKMLAMLKSSGLYGNQLILQFKNIIKAKNLDKNSEKYWQELKNVLDKLLIENSILFSGKIKDKMTELQENYKNTLKNAKEPQKEQAQAKKKKSGGAVKKKKKAPPVSLAKPMVTKPKLFFVDLGKVFSPLPKVTKPKPTYTPKVPPRTPPTVPPKVETEKDPFSGLMGPIFSHTRSKSRSSREKSSPKVKQPPKTKTGSEKTTDEGRSA